MRTAMVGTGYVGLVSGACFSEFGTDVVCVDKDAGKIERLERGGIPIFEPGLDALVASNREAGRLSFTTDLQSALDWPDAVFIPVGTPHGRSARESDPPLLHGAVRGVAGELNDHNWVVNEYKVGGRACRGVGREKYKN